MCNGGLISPLVQSRKQVYTNMTQWILNLTAQQRPRLISSTYWMQTAQGGWLHKQWHFGRDLGIFLEFLPKTQLTFRRQRSQLQNWKWEQDQIKLDYAGLEYNGLDWTRLDQTGLGYAGLIWILSPNRFLRKILLRVSNSFLERSCQLELVNVKPLENLMFDCWKVPTPFDRWYNITRNQI